MKKNAFTWLASLLLGAIPADLSAGDWPQWRGEKRDGIWREQGLIESFPEDGLARAWAFEVGPGYCGPTVAGDRVYLMDRGIDPAVEMERVLCVDRVTGEEVWSFAYPCVYEDVAYDLGPRASVTVADGRAFALGTMGHLHALDAASGEVMWKRHLIEEFSAEVPTWGVSAAPLVAHGRVIVQSGGTEGHSLIAIDAKTGAEVWRGPADLMTYSAPVIPPHAPDTVLVWAEQRLRALSIGTGEEIWSVEIPKTRPWAATVQSPVFNDRGDAFLLSDFNRGTRRFDQDGEGWKLTWHVQGKNERNTEGLHSLMGAPVWLDDHFYGVDSYGVFRCLRAEDSGRVWESEAVVPQGRWATAFAVRQGMDGGRVWIVNEVGELILADLSPSGYRELDRTQLIEPTQELRQREHPIVWSHPAFAHRHIYARNDRELIAISLADDGPNAPRR